jgi:hypothetical protein
MEGVIVLLVILLAATAFGLWRRRADVRIYDNVVPATPRETSAAGPLGTSSGPAAMTLTPDDLGQQLGRRATFVQFSTAFCQPCRANRQVLGHLAGTDNGVVHVDVDAESHLDLVRRLGVTRTPTTFVLDASGAIRRRATGPLRLEDARLAVAEL